MPTTRNRTVRAATKQSESGRRATRSEQSPLNPGLGASSAPTPGRRSRRRAAASGQPAPPTARAASSRRAGQASAIAKGKQLFPPTASAEIDDIPDRTAIMPTALATAAPGGVQALGSVEEEPAQDPPLGADESELGEGGESEYVFASRMHICVYVHVTVSTIFCLSRRGRARFLWSGS